MISEQKKQDLIAFFIYSKEVPDYSGLCKALEIYGFSKLEIQKILLEVAEGIQ
jgi:hypothetical protein